MAKETVKLNYLKIAPRKVRLVAHSIKGLTVNEAEARLSSLPHRSAAILLKFLRSASANIKNNQHKNPNNFSVESVRVDGGPMQKRMMARARGRGVSIQKKSSNVILVLNENEKSGEPRFKMDFERPKFTKKVSKPSKPNDDKEQFREDKSRDAVKIVKPGFFQKVFRRKSI